LPRDRKKLIAETQKSAEIKDPVYDAAGIDVDYQIRDDAYLLILKIYHPGADDVVCAKGMNALLTKGYR